jgi:ectoine hydroxylase-related dioxygenase (phytanoyl-CoA dioxygenase family)
MNILSDDQRDFYNNQGYLIMPGIFDMSEINDVRKVVFDTFEKFVEIGPDLLNLTQPWNQLDFDLALLRLRKSDAKLFGAMYDTAQNNTRLARMVTKNSLIMTAADLLNTTSEMIATSGHYLRMDAPQDKRNVLKWHQDRAYYHQNKDGNNGLVASVALQDISEENGGLIICPGSHKRGFLGVSDSGTKDAYEESEQLTVSGTEVSRYEEKNLELKLGEVLFINMNLLHKSGHNSTNRFRFSALARIHKIGADDYVPFENIFAYNPYCRDKIYGN